jgi:hypothetical protein
MAGEVYCLHLSAGCLGCPYRDKPEECPVITQYEDIAVKIAATEMLIKIQKDIEEINPRKC